MKTRDILRQAVGGVLFIDEAYTLAGGDGDSFGKEAIDEILAFMENRRDDMIVIAAGYDNEMRKFIELNPGLASRFTKTIVFADFSPPELAAVFAGNARKDQCGMAPAFQIRMLLACHLMHERRDRHFGNARDIRKLYEATQTRRLNRAAASGVAAMVLEARDLALPGLPGGKSLGAGASCNSYLRRLWQAVCAGMGCLGKQCVSPVIAETRCWRAS
jgi:hypothetical protein